MTGYGGLDGIRYETVPLKRVLKSNDGGAWGADSEAPETTPVAVLRSTDQSADGNWALESPAIRFLSAGEARATRLIEGDLVVTKSSGSERHIGKTTIVDSGVASLSPGFSNFMQRLRPNPRVAVPRFAWYFLNSQVAREQMVLASSTSTGLANLNAQVIGDLLIPLPSLEEQCRIAAFLDHETARIDELVHEQERLNSLLQEHKSGLILDVVTKGLEKRRELVPSGVFWIGQAPEGWAVAKLGLRYEVQLGKMLDAKQNVGGDQYPYLRNQDVQWDAINTDDLPTFRLEPTELVRYQVLQGDIMVCEGGDVGRAAMWTRRDGVFAYQKALHRLRPKNAERDFPSFLLYALRAAKEAGAYEQNDQRATISHLTAEAFREYKFPFPPIDEQRRIVEYLDREVSRVDELVAASRAATALLLERRSALISAAVTGQLDLRDWQPPEPEAVAEVA